MVRTKEAARRIRARRQKANSPGLDRRGMPMPDISWHVYRRCELCGGLYCSNNHTDRKVRIRRWQGFEVCTQCEIFSIRRIKDLMASGVLEFTQEFVDNIIVEGGKGRFIKPNRYPKRMRKALKERAKIAEKKKQARLRRAGLL